MGHGAANYASIVRAKAGKARRGRHLQNRLARSPVFVEFGEPNLRQFGDLCMLDLCHRHGCPTWAEYAPNGQVETMIAVGCYNNWTKICNLLKKRLRMSHLSWIKIFWENTKSCRNDEIWVFIFCALLRVTAQNGLK